MFQSMFKRAEDAIENTVGLLLIRALVVIPFLIAIAFGIAAAHGWLSREFSPETANLIIAAVFAAIGVALAIYASARAQQQTTGSATASASEPDTAKDGSSGLGGKSFSDVDRDLLYAALTSAAPVALPALGKMLMRNLPLLAAVGAALFIMSRNSDVDVRRAQAPAE